MERVVAAGFGVCCFMPFLKGGQQAGPRFRNNMVNWASPAFLMMYSAYKLNKQGDNIQP